MFEVAELGQTTSKAEFKTALETLRPRLVALGQALRSSKRGVIVLIGGVEGAGKSEVVNRLTEWLDPRGVDIHSFWEETDEERARPRDWRFWRRLPARGRIGIFFGSWYTQPIIDRAQDKIDQAQFDTALGQIRRLEDVLTADGYVLVKLWFHVGRATLKKRLRDAKRAHDATRKAEKKAARKGDQDAVGKLDAVRERTRDALRLSPLAKKFAKRYETFIAASERALRQTSTGAAPWSIIEATDARFRDLQAALRLVESTEAALALDALPSTRPPAVAMTTTESGPTILDRVDLHATLDDATYDTLIASAQDRLYRLAWQAKERGIATVMAFEGWDAAGKGGAIRRVTGGMDARLVQVVPIAAPTDEERAHPWLWRFWRALPSAGRAVIFDRTWYGRVLVERVEGFARPDEWGRAYDEINHFEEALIDDNIVVVKVWLHVSPQEQLRRFEERQTITWKQYKITPDDWRNRERWHAYRLAVHEMVAATSTAHAPWTLVAGDCKRHARVQVVTTVADALQRRLEERKC